MGLIVGVIVLVFVGLAVLVDVAVIVGVKLFDAVPEGVIVCGTVFDGEAPWLRDVVPLAVIVPVRLWVIVALFVAVDVGVIEPVMLGVNDALAPRECVLLCVGLAVEFAEREAVVVAVLEVVALIVGVKLLVAVDERVLVTVAVSVLLRVGDIVPVIETETVIICECAGVAESSSSSHAVANAEPVSRGGVWRCVPLFPARVIKTRAPFRLIGGGGVISAA